MQFCLWYNLFFSREDDGVRSSILSDVWRSSQSKGERGSSPLIIHPNRQTVPNHSFQLTPEELDTYHLTSCSSRVWRSVASCTPSQGVSLIPNQPCSESRRV